MKQHDEIQNVTALSRMAGGDEPKRLSTPETDEPDPETLILLMRYLDNDLDPHESRLVAQELAVNRRLLSTLDELRRGTEMAYRACAAWQASDESDGRIARLKLTNHRGWLWCPPRYRQAAAIIIGLAVGLVAGRVLTMSYFPRDQLRLASAAATTDPQDLTQRALATALVPLLMNSDSQSPGIAPLDDQASGMHGVLTLKRHLTLTVGVSCSEFKFESQVKTMPDLAGLACQQPNGGWQIMTLDMAR